MVPSFEVSHLPSSASFFSTILQPLGIVYISSDQTGSAPSHPGSSSQSPPVITYGTLSPYLAVLQLRQTIRPKRSYAVLSAPSPVSVSECHGLACRANPAGSGESLAGPRTMFGAAGGESQCRITDLDGNVVDIIYKASSTTSPRHVRDISSPIGVPPSQDQNGRVLDWNSSIDAPEKHPAPTVNEGSEPITILQRSVTTSVVEQPVRDTSSDQTSSATTTIIGALLGAAAGAALTYGVMKGEERRAARMEAVPPPVIRRATYPAEGIRDPTVTAGIDTGRSYHGSGQYMEVKKPAEQLCYPQKHAPVAEQWPPRQYLANYSQADVPNSRALAPYDGDDMRSHRSSYTVTQGHVASETRSTVSQTPRTPLMLMDHEHRSIAGSRHSSAKRHPSPARSCEPTDRDTYVSARSQRSASTIKGPPLPTVETELATRSRVSSRAPSEAPSEAPSLQQRSVVSSRHSTAGHDLGVKTSQAYSTAGASSVTVTRDKGGASGASVVDMPPPPTVETVLSTCSRAPDKAPSEAPSLKQRGVVGSRHSNVDYELGVPAGQSSSGNSASSVTVTKDRSGARDIDMPPPPTVETVLSTRSRAPSKAPSKPPSTKRSVVGSRHSNIDYELGVPAEQPYFRTSASSVTVTKDRSGASVVDALDSAATPRASRASSRVSARHIRLPMSGVGSSHAGWDDDHVSVAPSDSISCVGSRGARRHGP